jgi:cell division septum initiation protein DivIVA
MLRRVEVVQSGVVHDGPEPEADDVGSLLPAAGSTGVLDGLLDTRPVFRTRVNGYDRLQVDNYVTWAEDELAAARRAGDHLLARLTVCAAELAEYRRQPPPAPAPTPINPDLAAVSERVREILRLASDEAADIIQAAADEADQIVADAEVEAEARLRKTELMREAAIALVEQMRERVVRERTESIELLERARREADDLLRAAAAERDRLSAHVGDVLHAADAAVDEPNIAREYPLRPVAS